MPSNTAHRPTSAEIDLDILASNFHSTKDFVGTDVKYMAVVKANAYGHGAVECALRLESEGVDWFGVAIPEEGVEIRKAGVSLPILCLGSLWPGQEPQIIKNCLTPVIYNQATATNLNTEAAKSGSILDVHVKIDTGMGRVGIKYQEASTFAGIIRGLPNLRISGLLTHFAAAENPVENEFTELQISRFHTACDDFRDAGHRPEILDLANSPASIRHPASVGNLVRLGGALFGLLDDILPTDIAKPDLKPVLSLRSRITDIKTVPTGETLGYGRSFITTRESRIALVPIGYADGYPRALSNRGRVSVNGSNAAVVGRVSMDWTLIDVTDITNVRIGDEVILIGSNITAAEIARTIGTIGYEITCGLSPRVPRIYE